jgi:riboflavin biosynthesis pyrimidine reductase
VELVSANQDGQINLHRLLDKLYALGIKHLMVEGGAQIITAFLKNKTVDYLVLTIAPIFVGGLRAIDQTFAGELQADLAEGILAVDRFPRIHGIHFNQLGDDLIIWGKPKWKKI